MEKNCWTIIGQHKENRLQNHRDIPKLERNDRVMLTNAYENERTKIRLNRFIVIKKQRTLYCIFMCQVKPYNVKTRSVRKRELFAGSEYYFQIPTRVLRSIVMILFNQYSEEFGKLLEIV